MNKLEVGMYVRTNTGIHKIFEIDEKKTVWKYKCDKKSTGEWDGSYEFILLKKEQFIGEPSFNIRDLIEVGDIIKWETTKPYTDSGINEVIKYLNEGIGVYRIQADNLLKLEDLNIKSVVTHEQFKRMEYKI